MRGFLLPCLRSFFSLTVLACALCPLASSAAGQLASVSATAVFPDTTAYRLDKAKVSLPKDFGGALNLLVLSFEREQERDADSWLPEAQRIEQANPTFHVFLLPVFPKENILYRWWLNSSLRSSAPSPALWPRTIPLYLNKTDFRRALQIRDENQVVVLLADQNGKVVWRTEGSFSDEKKAQLASQLPANIK